MTDLANLRSDAPARQQDQAQLRRRGEATQQRFDAMIAARDADRAEQKRADRAAAKDAANATEPANAKDPAGKTATPAEPAPIQTKPRPVRSDASQPEATSQDDTAPTAANPARNAQDADADKDVAADQADATDKPARDTPVADGQLARAATDAPIDVPQPGQAPNGGAEGQGGHQQGQRQQPVPGIDTAQPAAMADPGASTALAAATATAPVVGLLALQAAPPEAIRLPAPPTTGRIDGAAPSRAGAPAFGFANAGLEKASLEIAKPSGAGMAAGNQFSAALSASRERDAAADQAPAATVADPQAVVSDLAAAAKITHLGETARNGPPGSAASATPAPAVPPEGIAITIATKLSEGIRRFEIRLDPAELGRVDVSLELSRDGRVHATLAVERMETLDMLRRDAPRLEQALREMGVTTGDRDVQLTLRDQGSPGDGRGEDARQRFAPAERTALVIPDTATDEAALSAAIYNRLAARSGGVDISI